jgi:hypothetical protein
MISRLRPGRRTLLLVAALSIAATVAFITASGSEELVTSTPSLTQKFTDVVSEKMLLDFCYQLRTIHGVTGVSYRDFNPAARSAVITVYYNPRITSSHNIKVFLQNARVLWVAPKSA